MKRFTFNDFNTDKEPKPLILGEQIHIPLFNPNVPKIFHKLALDGLNQCIGQHRDLVYAKSDHLIIMLVSDFNLNRSENEKYYISYFVWNDRDKLEKSIDYKLFISPNTDYFDKFHKLVLTEIENLSFNPFQNQKLVIELEPQEKLQLENLAKKNGYKSIRKYIVDILRLEMKKQQEKESRKKSKNKVVHDGQ